MKHRIYFLVILIFLSTISSTIGMVIIAIFSIIFISFFLLKEENILLKFILFMLPKHKENEIVSAVNTIISQLRKYFFGMFIRSLIVFVLLFTGLSFTGIGSSHIALIALLSAVLNIIPYIGPILGTALGMLIGALVCITTNTQIGPVQLLLVILILSVAIQLLDTIVFQPLISSKSVDAHPLEIFIVILVSGYIAGIVGMVLGVPVYTIFRVIAKVFYFDPRKKNKQMEEKIISENSEI